MTCQIIDGKTIAMQIKEEVASKIRERSSKGLAPPGLAMIVVGDDKASKIYVKNKRLACNLVGIKSFNFDLESNIEQSELIQLIEQLNNDDSIHGILVQLPLPDHIDQTIIIEKISPSKDVDGFHPYTVGRLSQRIPILRPCTPHGIMVLLKRSDVDFSGKHVVVVGASNHVGRPLALEMLLEGATITICHRFTKNLTKHVKEADILCVAVGKEKLISGDMIKEGAVVVDVGINRNSNNTIVGDVDFETVQKKASKITPVPGGVGPMTVAMLMKNTLDAAKMRD